jgi:putative transposase
MSRIIVAIIAMTGRDTMLGILRWTEKGGSYRSVQRFFSSVISWGTQAIINYQLGAKSATHTLAGTLNLQ